MKYFSTIGLRFIGLILILGITLNFYSNRPEQTASSASQTNPTLVSDLFETLSDDGPPRYIAHAGGRYQGKTYTNSIAALEASYQSGYRLEEIDLNLTTDNQIVLLHDWDATLERVYGLTPGQRDYASFATEATAFPVARPGELATWVAAHPTARVILDTKVNTLGILTEIATRYPELRGQFIPYIYNFTEYHAVSHLGYKNISLLTHTGQYSPDALLAFARSHNLHSIAMQPATLAVQKPALSRYARVYCWTINDPAIERELTKQHAYGVITDELLPAKTLKSTPTPSR